MHNKMCGCGFCAFVCPPTSSYKSKKVKDDTRQIVAKGSAVIVYESSCFANAMFIRVSVLFVLSFFILSFHCLSVSKTF